MKKQQRSMSLSDAWHDYEAHIQATLPQKKADERLTQTRTALLRYTLPGWGFTLPKGQRLTAQEREQGLLFMRQVRLEQLTEAAELQDKLFEQLDVAGNSQRNYRWALNSFIEWCKQQPWSVNITWTKEKRTTPSKRKKKEPTLDIREAGAKARFVYRLSKEQISVSLQQEMDAFRVFLTQGKFSVSEQMAQQHEQQVLRLLGWLHQIQHIPVEDLSLERLVPRTTRGKNSVSSLVCSYLGWLRDFKSGHSDLSEHALLSPHTAIRAIDTWIAVAKFVHLEEIEAVGWENKEKIPVFGALYEQRRREGKELKLCSDSRYSSKDGMNWTEFLELGEVLRSECTSRLPQSTQSRKGGMTRGPLRSLTAIAQSYQRFLCVALLSYIPPVRLGELQELKISLPTACSLDRSTSNVHPKNNLLYQDDDQRWISNTSNVYSRNNLLYQDGDQWWISIAPSKYKATVKSERRILLPNIRYEKGRCFYQYLEEWLLHYEYQDAQGKTISVPGFRSCFNPQHDYFFTLKSGQPYGPSSFRMLLNHSVYRFTEKPIISIRQMFLTHIHETYELSSIDLKKLALSMGHSIEQLELTFLPSRKLSQEDRQWAAEIAQAFIDRKLKEEAEP